MEVECSLDIESTDDVVTLRPLWQADAAEHLAGQDTEIIRWLSGGPSTLETVRGYIQRAETMWSAGGPIFTFGIRATNREALAGTIDVQLQRPYAAPGQANLAFGLYPAWRGQGLASRAVLLAVCCLREHTEAEQALIRAAPVNTSSCAAARRAGFHFVGKELTDSQEELEWFLRNVR